MNKFLTATAASISLAFVSVGHAAVQRVSPEPAAPEEINTGPEFDLRIVERDSCVFFQTNPFNIIKVGTVMVQDARFIDLDLNRDDVIYNLGDAGAVVFNALGEFKSKLGITDANSNAPFFEVLGSTMSVGAQEVPILQERCHKAQLDKFAT